jgi:dUTP pyrophosphatase
MSNSVGIIDAGYRHNIKVCVDNFSETDYQIKKGDRLFQICDASLRGMKVVLSDNLTKTNRGEGFGSSGK